MAHEPAAAAAPQHGDDGEFDSSHLLNSTEVEDDHKLSGYIQDNFEFLDQMDCSVMDHMDCGAYQVRHLSAEKMRYEGGKYF